MYSNGLWDNGSRKLIPPEKGWWGAQEERCMSCWKHQQCLLRATARLCWYVKAPALPQLFLCGLPPLAPIRRVWHPCCCCCCYQVYRPQHLPALCVLHRPHHLFASPLHVVAFLPMSLSAIGHLCWSCWLMILLMKTSPPSKSVCAQVVPCVDWWYSAPVKGASH